MKTRNELLKILVFILLIPKLRKKMKAFPELEGLMVGRKLKTALAGLYVRFGNKYFRPLRAKV